MAVDTDSKKRKAENDSVDVSKEDLKPVIDTLSKDQLAELLQEAALRHTDVLVALRKKADADPSARKIFVRGMDWDTKTESLRKVFSKYGEIEDAVVVFDKQAQRGRGYGFVTYVHLDSAIRCMKEPNKTVEGRMTTCNPAAEGAEHAKVLAENITHRKIYISNVQEDMTAESLHTFFSQYGEIAEGPLGYDKSGKSRGYALIIFKNLEGAKKALQEPLKTIDGYKLRCKLAESGIKDAAMNAVKSSVLIPNASTGLLAGYSGFPYLPVGHSLMPSGGSLNPAFNSMLANPLAQNYKSVANIPGIGLGQSFNPLLSMDPSLAASLYPSLASLPSDGGPQAGQGLQVASSLGVNSLGVSGGLSAYPQLAAYTRLASNSVYDAATSSTSQAGVSPGSAIASYLGATPAERAQIAGALGSLAAYYDR